MVLEKHADVFRDFRGGAVHPSTLQVMWEVGLLDDFLQRPHDQLAEISAVIGGQSIALADFRHLPTAVKFIALRSQ
jgi:hypothetical protein